jgi:hypothetical protein
MKTLRLPALRLGSASRRRALPIPTAALTILILLASSIGGVAQQSLNNEAVIKLVQGGLSDDLIISTIRASPGVYDASADGLIALKSSGVSNAVIAAVVAKSAASGNSAPVGRTEAAAPPLPLGLCDFRLDGSSKAGNAAPLVGVLGGLPAGAVVGASGHHHAYFEGLNKQVEGVYETTLAESVQYRVVSGDTLRDSSGKRHLSMAAIAQGNGLFACVSAKPSWAAQFGKDKRAVITTRWEVVRPGGCKVKFMTSASSAESYQKLPNGADSTMSSVYIGLSKQDARKFMENLPSEMKRTGCGQDR